MTSFKAYLITWIVWWTYKGSFQSAEGLHARIKRERPLKHNPPEHLRKRFIIEEREQRGFAIFDVSPKSETPSKARVLYLHGGAFLFGPTPIHWEFVALLAERLQAVVSVARYPLGPDYKLLDMYDVLQPLHDEMAAAQVDTPFFLMGDSAGGTLSLALSQLALKAKKPVAKRVVLITPCMDCTLSNPDVQKVLPNDPWMDVPGILEIPRIICPELDPRDPRASPIYGDLDGLPPMLVFAAGRDLLSPDAKRFVELAKAKGREVELVEGEGMVHVWPILPLPEASQAVDKMIKWLE